MSIRAARDADFPALAAITNHYITTTTIHFAYEPVLATDLLAEFHAHERYPWFVTEREGTVVGFAKAAAWRERDAYHWTCETGIYLAPDACGQGRARPLYTRLLDELTARGFRSVVAGITLPNEPSVALHRALGFADVGTVRDAGYKSGAWHAVGFWQKQLSTSTAAPTR